MDTPIEAAADAPTHVNGTAAAADLHIQLPSQSIDDAGASTVPAVGTPAADPHSIPVGAPRGTPPPAPGALLPDVEMAEEGAPSETYADEPVAEGVPELVVNTNGDVVDPADPADHGVLGGAHPHSTATPAMEDMNIVPELEAQREEEMKEEEEEEAVPSGPADVNDMEVEPPAVGSPLTPPPAKREDGPPPAKRPRIGPISTTTTNGHGRHAPRSPTISAAQFKFFMSTIKYLRKQKDAAPFQAPVDPIALNIPHYPAVITEPMDLGTIEAKLVLSNPGGTKTGAPASSTDVPPDIRYWDSAGIIRDMRLVFENAVRFNGPEHAVSLMARRLETILERQLRSMPPDGADPAPKEQKPITVSASLPIIPTYVSPPPAPAPAKPARRQSIAIPTARRNSPGPQSAVSQRPKREIHPPPPRDLPYAGDAGVKRKRGKGKGRDDGTAEQLRFCATVIAHLNKKMFYNIAYPFYDPVDPVALGLPDYPKIIKKPMDISTMKDKLARGQYASADKFHADFKLIIKNCHTFNPAGSPVHIAGTELNKVFDEKWKALPPLHAPADSDDEEEEEEEEDVDARDEVIETLMRNIEKMNADIQKIRKDKESGKKKKDKGAVVSKPGTSKPKKMKTGGPTSPTVPKRMKGSKAKGEEESDEDGPVDFFKKKELADEIPQLEGPDLSAVLKLIQESMTGKNLEVDEEIELDIDVLAPSVIRKLYRMVVLPAKKRREADEKKRVRVASGGGVGGGRGGGNAAKGGRKGAPTGGLKRKSMDEEAEAARIRLLEERVKLFDGNTQPASAGGAGGAGGAASWPMVNADADDSVHSSGEDSSDSSGTDSGSE